MVRPHASLCVCVPVCARLRPPLRRSLTDNQLYLSRQDLSPLPYGSKPSPLKEPERILVSF